MVVITSLLIWCFLLRQVWGVVVSCKNSVGEDVEWFAMIKPPENVKYNNPSETITLYFDSKLTTDTFNIDPVRVDNHPAFKKTMNQILDPNIVYMFNNQFGGLKGKNDHGANGHVKGVIAISQDKSSGFYLMHSFPNYFKENGQQSPEWYSLSENALIYAQHVFCLSPKADNNFVKDLEPLLVYVKAKLYMFQTINIQVPQSFLAIQSYQLEQGAIKRFSQKMNNNPQNGHLFKRIQEEYRTTLYIESFLGETLDQTLQKNEIIYLPDHKFFRKNHAKLVWDKRENLVCFCDLYLNLSNLLRGGSCFCLQNEHLSKAVKTLWTPNGAKIPKKRKSRDKKENSRANRYRRARKRIKLSR